MAGKKKGSWSSNIRYILFLIAFTVLAGELIVRLMGFSPYRPPQQGLDIRPEGPFFKPHPSLGYAGKAGEFDLSLQQGDARPLSFHVSHNAEGYRITRPISDSLPQGPQVWIFGCSFTHGYGVDDSATFPWRLQQRFPKLDIRNYGMDGYGSYHSLLQFRALLASGQQPAMVILAYGGFHDQRNVNSRYWRKALSGQKIAEGIAYPYLRMEGDSIVEAIGPIEYEGWTGMRYSALVHFLENAWNRSEDASLNSYAVTQFVIREMHHLARERGIPFLLAGIFPDEGTKRMVEEMKPEMEALDVSAGLELEENRILPSDLHPNAAGHKLIAARLAPFLEAISAGTNSPDSLK